jgi:hypothetical protein
MENARHIGCMWALAVAVGVGMAVANTPAVASAAPDDSGKGSSSQGSASSEKPSAKRASSATNDTPGHRRRPPKRPDETAVTSISSVGTADNRPAPKKHDTDVRKRGGASSLPVVRAAVAPAIASPSRTSVVTSPAPADPTVGTSAVDPDFISSTHNLGLFSVTSAADPDDNHYVAFVLSSLIFTFVLTSGTDPEDNLGFGTASTGVAGHTVGTVISPFLNFSVAIPVEDPFAELFTQLVRAGF